LIRGKKDMTREEEETLDDLEVTQEKRRAIQAKYIGGRKISRKDQRELEQLERKERLLSKRSNVIEHSKNSWYNKCVQYTRPFQVLYLYIFPSSFSLFPFFRPSPHFFQNLLF